jgi:cellulose biosynthesis protein BcsQ
LKKIAFHVEKGGTGKTTMAGNIAAILADEGRRTIMLDLDPQANLTSWYVDGGIKHDTADYLQERARLEDTIVNVRKDLDIVPTIAIDGELKQWAETQLISEPFAFDSMVDELEGLGYDMAVFDLGPGISTLEKSVLSTVNEVVGVAYAEYWSFDGLEIFQNELEKLRKKRRATFETGKIVLNRINKAYNLHKIYREKFNDFSYQIYQVGQSTPISECVVFHKPLIEHDPKNRNITEMRRLAVDLMNGQRNL